MNPSAAKIYPAKMTTFTVLIIFPPHTGPVTFTNDLTVNGNIDMEDYAIIDIVDISDLDDAVVKINGGPQTVGGMKTFADIVTGIIWFMTLLAITRCHSHSCKLVSHHIQGGIKKF